MIPINDVMVWKEDNYIMNLHLHIKVLNIFMFVFILFILILLWLDDLTLIIYLFRVINFLFCSLSLIFFYRILLLLLFILFDDRFPFELYHMLLCLANRIFNTILLFISFLFIHCNLGVSFSIFFVFRYFNFFLFSVY